MIPYTRHLVDEIDIAAVARVLRSERLTQGQEVQAFEAALAAQVGARYVVALSSGTMALRALAASASTARVVTTPLTFAATVASFESYTAVELADVDDATLILSLNEVPDGASVLAMDYAGHPSPAAYPGTTVYLDAAHSFGAPGHAQRAAAAVYSFHPAKTITTGEGGAAATDDGDLAVWIRRYRDHGRDENGAVVDEGGNGRMSELHAALGRSQLGKLALFLARRRAIAARYLTALADVSGWLVLPASHPDHVWHLFVVRVPAARRDRFRAVLADAGIGTQIHYRLIYEHPRWRQLRPKHGCPVAEQAAGEVVSLPMSAALTDEEVERVIDGVRRAAGRIL